MARDMQAEAVESTKANNKLFLNIYATNKAGKKIKVGMTTLDYNLTKGTASAKKFTENLIKLAQSKGGQVTLNSGLTATFVIADSDESDDDDFDLEAMTE